MTLNYPTTDSDLNLLLKMDVKLLSSARFSSAVLQKILLLLQNLHLGIEALHVSFLNSKETDSEPTFSKNNGVVDVLTEFLHQSSLQICNFARTDYE